MAKGLRVGFGSFLFYAWAIIIIGVESLGAPVLARSRVEYGLSVGGTIGRWEYNAPRPYFTQYVTRAWVVRPTYGIFAEYKIRNHWALQTEIRIAKSGFKEEWFEGNYQGEPLDTPTRATTTLKYVLIPMTLRWVPFRRKVQPYLCAGPVWGHLLGAWEKRITPVGTELGFPGTRINNVTDEFPLKRSGYLIGTGTKVVSGKETVTFVLDYFHALRTDVIEIGGATIEGHDDLVELRLEISL